MAKTAEPERLTPQEYLTLKAIDELLNTNPWPPTVREICAASGRTGLGSVHDQVNSLVRKGWIERSRKWRSIRILHELPKVGRKAEVA